MASLRAQDERARWFIFSCIDQLMLIIMGIGEDDEKTGKGWGAQLKYLTWEPNVMFSKIVQNLVL